MKRISSKLNKAPFSYGFFSIVLVIVMAKSYPFGSYNVSLTDKLFWISFYSFFIGKFLFNTIKFLHKNFNRNHPQFFITTYLLVLFLSTSCIVAIEEIKMNNAQELLVCKWDDESTRSGKLIFLNNGKYIATQYMNILGKKSRNIGSYTFTKSKLAFELQNTPNYIANQYRLLHKYKTLQTIDNTNLLYINYLHDSMIQFSIQ